jgi:hypothetical protein
LLEPLVNAEKHLHFQDSELKWEKPQVNATVIRDRSAIAKTVGSGAV